MGKFLDEHGLGYLLDEHLRPEGEPSQESQHPVTNQLFTETTLNTLQTINNLKSLSYGHVGTAEDLPGENNSAANQIYTVGERLITDDTSEVYEVTAVDSETGELTWTKTSIVLGGGKVNAEAVENLDNVAELEDGFYLNVDEWKVYEVKDGVATESIKEIDTCKIEFELYEANKETLDEMKVLFVISNAPGVEGSSGGSGGGSSITIDTEVNMDSGDDTVPSSKVAYEIQQTAEMAEAVANTALEAMAMTMSKVGERVAQEQQVHTSSDFILDFEMKDYVDSPAQCRGHLLHEARAFRNFIRNNYGRLVAVLFQKVGNTNIDDNSDTYSGYNLSWICPNTWEMTNRRYQADKINNVTYSFGGVVLDSVSSGADAYGGGIWSVTARQDHIGVTVKNFSNSGNSQENLDFVIHFNPNTIDDSSNDDDSYIEIYHSGDSYYLDKDTTASDSDWTAFRNEVLNGDGAGGVLRGCNVAFWVLN